ncbi:MAG: T9SS type A sorting domain-containing protein [Bacteroidia bacterium]
MTAKTFITNLFFFIILFFHHSFLLQAQPVLIWERSYGGSLYDQPFTTESSFENGYISGGHSISADSDITSNYGDFDYWVLKLDSNCNKIWSKSYGGSLYDKCRGLSVTPDSSILSFGSVKSNDSDVTGNHGKNDLWLLKLDYNGNKVWSKCYGGTKDEAGYITTYNNIGNYICGSNTLSDDGDVSFHHGLYDAWLIEVTPDSGKIVREKTYGGSNHDEIRGIDQWPDSDYVFAGNTRSSDGDLSGTTHQGDEDLWAVRIDKLGNIIWSVQYGTNGPDRARHITRDFDGNVLLTGKDSLNSGIVTDNHGDADIWLVKLNYLDGSVMWQKSFGGSDKDEGFRTIPTADHGYLVGATTQSNDGDSPGVRGLSDFYFIKLDSLLNIQWTYTAGGPGWDHLNDVLPTSDGAYIGVGFTSSVAGPNSQITNSKGDYDSWYVKIGYCDSMPVPSITGNTIICNGDSVTLTAPTGQTYLWNTGETTQSLIVKNAGSYMVTVTKWDSACIQHSATIIIDTFPQPPVPLISFSAGQLDASPAAAYQWYYNGILLPDTAQVISTVGIGTYQLIITDSNGCIAQSQPFLLTAINDLNDYDEIFIASNPVINNVVYFNVKNDFTPTAFELIDITGKRIFNSQIEFQNGNLFKIKLPDVKSGFYFLKIIDNKWMSHISKIVVG